MCVCVEYVFGAVFFVCLFVCVCVCVFVFDCVCVCVSYFDFLDLSQAYHLQQLHILTAPLPVAQVTVHPSPSFAEQSGRRSIGNRNTGMTVLTRASVVLDLHCTTPGVGLVEEGFFPEAVTVHIARFRKMGSLGGSCCAHEFVSNDGDFQKSGVWFDFEPPNSVP